MYPANMVKIDVSRYFLNVDSGLANPKKQVNRVMTFGQQAVYDDRAIFGDADNAWGLIEFANGKSLQTHLSQTITNGLVACTSVCGTKGHSIIDGNSTLHRADIRDAYVVRTASTSDAFALYDKTFVNDIAEFASAVLDNLPLSCNSGDALRLARLLVPHNIPFASASVYRSTTREIQLRSHRADSSLRLVVMNPIDKS
jgi:myo-inositol 2-dehydrogenase/D-chiro-inositol 1-dehydrogenase